VSPRPFTLASALTTALAVSSVVAPALALTLAPASAVAQSPEAPLESVEMAHEFDALDRPFAFSAYVSGWAGSYLAGGVGGRLRWEPFAELGVEVFGEGHIVEWPVGIRHDHQIGFNLYVPFELLPGFRVRPLFGFCTVFSLIEPPDASAPRADDVLFGAHAGAGIELAIETWGSWFFEAQAAVWAGHDRSQSRWTGTVEDTYAPFATAQVLTGFAVHFGDP
jgi:hypothetical protein